jgi:hypothetical protein
MEKMKSERAYSTRLHERIETVWNECISFSSHMAEPIHLYFQSRGLIFKVDKVEISNSLINGNLVTLHQTYLTQSGKKTKVVNAKNMTPIPTRLEVNGVTGEKSANVLKVRFEKQGVQVYVLLPKLPILAKEKDIDWNDSW